MSDNLFTMGAEVEKQEERDSVGMKTFDSGFMEFTIKSAFLNDYPKSGSKGLFLELETPTGEKFFMDECVWSAKTKAPTYIDSKTGKERELIGFSKLNSFSKLLTGKTLEKSVFEKRVHEIYNKDAGAKVPTPLPTLVEWTDKVIHVGMLKEVKNKQTKSGEKYVDTNESIETNSIDKWFNAEKFTLLEVEANAKKPEDQQKPAEFYLDWIKANEGKTRDRFKQVGAKSGAVGGGKPAGASAPALDFTE